MYFLDPPHESCSRLAKKKKKIKFGVVMRTVSSVLLCIQFYLQAAVIVLTSI